MCSPQGQDCIHETSDSKIHLKLWQAITKCMSTNPQRRKLPAPLPTGWFPGNLWMGGKVYQGDLCFTFSPPAPDLSLSTQFVRILTYSHHWVLWNFNFVIENVLEGKLALQTVPHGFNPESCSSAHVPDFPTQTLAKESGKSLRTWPPYKGFGIIMALEIKGRMMLLG